MREWYESFARDYMLVCYDNRGTGLSDRNITEHTVDAMANDLEGVVDHLSLERFALFGMGHSGVVSIAYAVRHPERVTRLMLWAAYAQATEYLQRPRLDAVSTTLNEDRAAATVALIGALAGPASSELQRSLVDLYRRATSEEYFELRDQAPVIDVTSLLPQVKVPTVVMHRPDFPLRRDADARDLATGIPDARLISFEGSSCLWFDDPIVTETMKDFLVEDKPIDSPTSENPGAGVRDRASAGPQPGTAGLTHREVEVLRLIADGRSNREISEELVITLNTVFRHLSNIFTKIGAANRVEATVYANQHGLLENFN